MTCSQAWGDVGRYVEKRGDMAERDDLLAGVGRCGEMWGDVGRYGEVWGDMGR